MILVWMLEKEKTQALDGALSCGQKKSPTELTVGDF
jgi:hypothetical protein